MRWEYRIISMYGDNVDARLAGAGLEGWEAVSVYTVPPGHAEHVFVLVKRPLLPSVVRPVGITSHHPGTDRTGHPVGECEQRGCPS